MDETITPEVNRPLLSPRQMGAALPARAVLASEGNGWQSVTLQRVNHGSAKVDFSGFRDHLLTLQLAGPVYVENKQDGGRKERFWFEKGQTNFLPAGHPVNREMKGKTEVLLVSLHPELMTEVIESVFDRDPGAASIRPFVGTLDVTLRSYCELFLTEATLEAPGSNLMAASLGRALALHLLRQHSNLSYTALRKTAAIASGRLGRVLDHMREHLDQPITLGDLAALGGLSQSHFAHAFRDATGQPPHRYLIGLRMEKARALLESSKLSVLDISLRCGFESSTHFATMFHKVVGMSPRAWRVARRS